MRKYEQVTVPNPAYVLEERVIALEQEVARLKEAYDMQLANADRQAKVAAERVCDTLGARVRALEDRLASMPSADELKAATVASAPMHRYGMGPGVDALNARIADLSKSISVHDFLTAYADATEGKA